jgi:hypothetical protein
MGMVLLLLAACQRSDNSQTKPSVGTGRASGDSLEIRTTDGTMKLGLEHDTVFMGLTDSVLAVARKDMATDTEETGNAFASKIEGFVKSKVSSALATRLKYPLADIDSATYQGGAIKFAYRNRRKMAFEDVNQNGRKALQSFAPDDARRFVATVNSAIRAERGGEE